MLSWCIRIIVLALVWWICSGFTEPFFLFMGIVSVLAALYITDRLGLFASAAHITQHLSRLPMYLLWLIKEIYHASMSVTRIVWQVTPAASPGLGWVEAKLKNRVALALFGNSITLTPGTICADIVEEKNRTLVLVHALEKSGYDDVANGRMERRVRRAIDNPRGTPTRANTTRSSKKTKAANAWW